MGMKEGCIDEWLCRKVTGFCKLLEGVFVAELLFLVTVSKVLAEE